MNERKICSQCGFSNGARNHFCVKCGASLEKPAAKATACWRRLKGWKWLAKTAVVACVFAVGLCAGLLVNQQANDDESSLVGRRVAKAWKFAQRDISRDLELLWVADDFSRGPRQYWHPQWSVLRFGTQKVGDYLFEFLYDTMNVYTEGLSLYRQLDDYEIIAAVTDGNKVYMQVETVYENDMNNQFAVWDFESNQFIFLDAIWIWPDLPRVGLAGGTSKGIYYYRSTDGTYADWYRYDFEGGTMNTGSHVGALACVGEYEGQEYFISKSIPFSVYFHINQAAPLNFVTSDGTEDMEISNGATVVRAFENDIYFLEQKAQGLIFKKFSVETKTVEVLSSTPVYATDFQLILGGNGAVFSCSMDNLEGQFPKEMCGFADFRTGEVYTMEAAANSAVYGGRRGYLYDREANQLYCFDPLSCEISEIYQAPEDWFVYDVTELERDTICVRLVNEKDTAKVEYRKVEV